MANVVSDSDSSDEEFWEEVDAYMASERVPRVFRDRTNPLTMYGDVEFRIRFRLGKDCGNPSFSGR